MVHGVRQENSKKCGVALSAVSIVVSIAKKIERGMVGKVRRRGKNKYVSEKNSESEETFGLSLVGRLMVYVNPVSITFFRQGRAQVLQG